MDDLIEKLSNLRSQLFNLFDKNECEAYHALSEAIKVISERPEPCEDAVSRQAAIEAVFKNDRHTTIRQRLDALSSVQPDITDEQAIEHLQSTGWMQSHDRILTQSTWDIIRCKDCKHYRPEVGSYEYALGYCPFINSHLVMNEGFCAWAERRTDVK